MLIHISFLCEISLADVSNVFSYALVDVRVADEIRALFKFLSAISMHALDVFYLRFFMFMVCHFVLKPFKDFIQVPIPSLFRTREFVSLIRRLHSLTDRVI